MISCAPPDSLISQLTLRLESEGVCNSYCQQCESHYALANLLLELAGQPFH